MKRHWDARIILFLHGMSQECDHMTKILLNKYSAAAWYETFNNWSKLLHNRSQVQWWLRTNNLNVVVHEKLGFDAMGNGPLPNPYRQMASSFNFVSANSSFGGWLHNLITQKHIFSLRAVTDRLHKFRNFIFISSFHFSILNTLIFLFKVSLVKICKFSNLQIKNTIIIGKKKRKNLMP